MATIIATGLPKAQTGTETPSSNASTFGEDKKGATTEVTEIPPLGVPLEEKRFFFQRARAYDPDAIATLVRERKCDCAPVLLANMHKAQCVR